MAIKFASWNVEGRLSGYQTSGRGTAGHILDEIARLDADVLVLPEFYIDSLPDKVRKQLREFGYEIFEAVYDDVGREAYERERWGQERIGLLSQLAISNVRKIRPGGLRNLITCDIVDPDSGKKVRVFAIHLEDRTEVMRVKQAEGLVEIINEIDMPTVLLGDFNAMWPRGYAKLFHSWAVRRLVRIIPYKELRSMGMRVTGMASGQALRVLADHTKLREADLRYRATATPKQRFASYMPSIRLLQIDHMLVSSKVSVHEFTVHGDGGSDHRAISAILTFDDRTSMGEIHHEA